MLLPDALDILADRLRAIDGLTVTTDPAAEVVVPMAGVEDGELDFNTFIQTVLAPAPCKAPL